MWSPIAHLASSLLKFLSFQQPLLSAGDYAAYLGGQEKPYEVVSPTPCYQILLTNIHLCPACLTSSYNREAA